jgi:hypothetical protein
VADPRYVKRVRNLFRVWIPASSAVFFVVGYALGGIGEALFMTALVATGGWLAYYVIAKSYR